MRKATDLWIILGSVDFFRGGDGDRRSDLCIARVCVEYVRKKLGCDSYACYDEAVDVKVINDKLAACRLFRELGHAIKIDQKRYEDLVCGRAVFEDSEKVGLEGDSRYIASMK